MKRIVFFAAIAIGSMVLLSSCEEDEDLLGTARIQLENESKFSMENIDVKLLNTVDNKEIILASDAQGIALFENLPVGTYNASVSVNKNEENLIITGVKTGIVVKSNEITNATISLNVLNPKRGLVIKELYSCGANDGYKSLFKDQFIEIFNNSGETLYADGIYIANLYGDTGTATSKTDEPITDVLDIKDYVYADFIDRIPGNGTEYPVEPGKSIIIALNAMNFKEDNPKADWAVDNTNADLERYSVKWLEDQGRQGNTWFDFDNPDVPNMINVSMLTNLWLFNSYGTAAVLIKKDTKFDESGIIEYKKTTGGSTVKLMQVPVESIIDGIEILENSAAGKFKRLPSSIDAGFTFLKADGGAFYSSMSSRRKVDIKATKAFGRVILQDTNNSGEDFETVLPPTPRCYDNYTIK